MGHKVGQWVRAGAWFAIGGQVVFVVAWVTAGALQPGYSSIDNYVSELAADSAAHPWIVGAAIVVWGLSIAAIGPALLPALRGRPWRTGVAALFVVAGVLFALAGVFQLDCGPTMSHACKSAEKAGDLSWHHYAHGWSSFGAEIALALTPFALARALWPRLLSVSLVQGGLFGIALGVLGSFSDAHDTVAAGLGQRIEVAVLHSWIVLVAIGVLWWARDSASGAELNLAEPAERRAFELYWRQYGFYIERTRLSRLVARLTVGGSLRPFYESMAAIGEVADGGLVVDAPCRTGAMLGLSPTQRIRYRAVDPWPEMLERARRRVARRGLNQVELVEAEPDAIPVADATVDLFVSLFGLHWHPRPREAVREIGRCLRPGGRVVGAMVCNGTTLRQRLIVHPGTGGFGPTGTAADLRAWLGEAGLSACEIRLSGPFAYFRATRG